jgi:lysophospholipase L1-like esterase
MRYVAIGDSFSEGVGDELPDGSVRGWTDLVAAGLSAGLAERGETLEYANLAIRGRLLRPIVTTQLDAALALEPKADLITFNGGGNDMLRPGVDLAGLVTLIEQAIVRAQEAGVRMVVLAGADPTGHLPFGRTIRGRVQFLTAATIELCAKHDVTLVNAFGDVEIRSAHYWSADRLHLNDAGHRRVADLVLHALGFAPAPEPAPAPAAGRGGLAANARYYREHVLPWIQRRVRGRSSGDNRDPKHASWHLIEPGATGSLS